MLNKFQVLISKLLENNTVGAVLGQSAEPMFNPPTGVTSKDSYAPKHMITPKLLGKKIIKRKFPENIILNKDKKIKNKK
jgi:hypothetical protein